MNLIINEDCQIPNLGEILSKYLPEIGTFVEVGAYDGITHSNTLPLIKAGWSGIYIEPILEYFIKCSKNLSEYKKAVILNKAVANFFGTSEMIKRGEWSTIDGSYNKLVNDHPSASEDLGKETVMVMPLDSILMDQKIENIDLLVIDVEGSEIEVLQGFSIDRYSPKMIIIELHEQSKFWQLHNDVYLNTQVINNFLIELCGYKKIFSDDINSIFIKENI